MNTSPSNTVGSRRSERQALADQVAEFLKMGGKITVVASPASEQKVKPKGSVWLNNDLQ